MPQVVTDSKRFANPRMVIMGLEHCGFQVTLDAPSGLISITWPDQKATIYLEELPLRCEPLYVMDRDHDGGKGTYMIDLGDPPANIGRTILHLIAKTDNYNVSAYKIEPSMRRFTPKVLKIEIE